MAERKEGSELFERVVYIGRVAKVVKGGKRFSFSALVVLGDQDGRVGFGVGKAREVPAAVKKAVDQAKRGMIKVSVFGGTIPHEVLGHYGSGRVVMKPASAGTGVIAGGTVRAVLEAVGVKNILTKSLGSRNPHNIIKATLNGLQQLRSHEDQQRLVGGAA